MSETVERAVASFLGQEDVDWESLKPVTSFVVLWNRLEAECGFRLSCSTLIRRVEEVAGSPQFDIGVYEPHVRFFRSRYSNSAGLLPDLFWNRDAPEVEQLIRSLLDGSSVSHHDVLKGVMMIPYRIRNNLFHGRKDTAILYLQTEFFTQVNEVLCLFHANLRKARGYA